ncbi:MAG: DUF4352 domain-containing protein [Planctomycetes bacterium]|nr:DUF4352 domain-containing protein [Planctomycetota bacterium]
MQPRRTGPFLRAALVLFGLSAAFVLVLGAFVHEDVHVAVGEELRHDDFGFRVMDVSTEGALGGSALQPRGRFVVVELAIANHAKRVPFQLRSWTPVLFDASGRVHAPEGSAQGALETLHGECARLEGSVAAGERATRWLVYDVPTDARDVRFRIQWGGAILDALEGFVFGAKDVALGDLAALSARGHASDDVELGARER